MNSLKLFNILRSLTRKKVLKVLWSSTSKQPLLKTKVIGKNTNSGRNNQGIITVRHKGGGHKQKYRKINFYRNYESTGIVLSIEYDPNRSSYIASVYDLLKNEFFYILAPQKLKIGHIVKSGTDVEPMTGNSLPVCKIPEGSYIHNISTHPKKKSQIARSAGTYSIITEKNKLFSKLSLRSGEQRWIPSNCFATIGKLSNELHNLKKKKKAGQSRWLNKRPTVRGVAMNPVDHPHGGGEGKKSGKSLSPWSKPNKRGATSRSKNKLIIKNYKNEKI